MALLLAAPAGFAQKAMKIRIQNPDAALRKDVLVKIPAGDLQQRGLIPVAGSYLEVRLGKTVLPYQWNDMDHDGQPEELALLLDVAPSGPKNVQLRLLRGSDLPTFEKRTQAELSHKTGGHWEGRKYIGGSFQNVASLQVPPEHTDHSYFIRYEGPGWESDKVGYRFYLDWRNATDIFGKTTSRMVLQDVGQDGFDSYHALSDWGMDVLKVGESLGIGSLGYWNNGKAQRVDVTDGLFSEVALNGPVESAIRTVYTGWKAGANKTDVISELSITAGSHLTRHKVQLSAALENLCTGIVKLPDAERFESAPTVGEWAYLATFGKQSLNNDMLGMAVFYRKRDVIERTEDKNSHVVVLRPSGNELEYYFMGAWEKEPGGPATKAAFQQYLETILSTLNRPVAVTY